MEEKNLNKEVVKGTLRRKCGARQNHLDGRGRPAIPNSKAVTLYYIKSYQKIRQKSSFCKLFPYNNLRF
jgi:hypothetical protein